MFSPRLLPSFFPPHCLITLTGSEIPEELFSAHLTCPHQPSHPANCIKCQNETRISAVQVPLFFDKPKANAEASTCRPFPRGTGKVFMSRQLGFGGISFCT